MPAVGMWVQAGRQNNTIYSLEADAKKREIGEFPLTPDDHHNFWNEFVMLFVTTF